MWKFLLFLFLSGERSVIWLGRDWENSVISEEPLTSPVYNRTSDLYSSRLDFLSRSFDAFALNVLLLVYFQIMRSATHLNHTLNASLRKPRSYGFHQTPSPPTPTTSLGEGEGAFNGQIKLRGAPNKADIA
jgi:hypothetical protein